MDFSNRIASLKPSAIREIFKVLGDKSIISFAGGNPDPATFPAKEMGDIAGELFRTRPEDALQYSITEGYPPLRKQLSERMKIKFGIGREFDETIIVTGGQQGLDLTCKVLCNEGDVVICEEPSFIGALNCFRATGAKLEGIEMEPDGMNIEKLEHVLKTEKRAKMIYIIPTFQNPMGITTSEKKREQIYFLAKKYGVIILEDNPYGELRFAGKDIPTLKSRDENGIVIYCSSFSKILSPGMRMGYVCAPKPIIEKMVVAKQVNDVHTNIFFQMTVSEYLSRENIDLHIEENRKIYKEKAGRMLSKMDETFPEDVTYTRPEGGLFIWCDLGHGINTNEFSVKLLQKKVAVVPGSAFLCNENAVSSAIRLNYSMPSYDQIDLGISKIAELIKEEIGR